MQLPKNYNYQITVEMSSAEGKTGDLNEQLLLHLFEKLIAECNIARGNASLIVKSVTKA